MLPEIWICPSSHCLRAFTRLNSLVNSVPMLSPAHSRTNTSGSRPEATTVLAPLNAARFAANTLVYIPPVPTPVPAPPAMLSKSGWAAEIWLINCACGFLRGSLSYKPRWSVRIISASASTKLVTSAPSVSLSPSLISAVVTLSFSLITGTIFCASSVCSVLRAFR